MSLPRLNSLSVTVTKKKEAAPPKKAHCLSHLEYWIGVEFKRSQSVNRSLDVTYIFPKTFSNFLQGNLRCSLITGQTYLSSQTNEAKVTMPP